MLPARNPKVQVEEIELDENSDLADNQISKMRRRVTLVWVTYETLSDVFKSNTQCPVQSYGAKTCTLMLNQQIN